MARSTLQTLCVALLASSTYAYTVNVVADGFTWAENLRCDPVGRVLWVSDLFGSTLYTIRPSASGYTKTVHLGPEQGFHKFLGITLSHDSPGEVYVVAALTTQKSNSMIIRVNATSPGEYEHVATLPKRGNGLDLDKTTGMIYSPTEGDFYPKAGAVYQIDPTDGTVVTIIKDSWTDDGAFIDQDRRLLYVSEVISDKMLVFSLDSKVPTLNHTFHTPVYSIDDYTLDESGTTFYAANYLGQRVVSFGVDGSSGMRTLLDKNQVTYPTSVRWGCLTDSPGLNRTSLFVSEGGSLNPSVHSHRVLEIVDVRQ